MVLPAIGGCLRPAPAAPTQPEPAAAEKAAAVKTVRPERKTVRRAIEQPGYNIEAFQQTPLYAKIAGYVRQVNVDIGDPVHKDDVLAELWVPEMEVELRQKEASVRQARAEVLQVKAAGRRAAAELERSKSQYERLARLGRTSGVIDKENIDETRYGFEAAQAGVEKAKADLAAAEARLEAAEADRDHVKTLLQYTRVPAPFDGVVTRRNVDTGHFVQPAGGGKGEPLFVVEQVDPVRVFVNVPELDAVWVRDGAPANVRVQGLQGRQFQGKVTRSSWSLNPRTRTLRTEIDLPNPEGALRLRPGMFVYATITAEHPDVWTLPASAVVAQGDQTFCTRLVDGKPVRVPVQVGLSGGGLVEVVKKQEGAKWEDFTGAEEVVEQPAEH